MIVDSTYIGCPDHFLVWMEIGRVTKRGKKVKHLEGGVWKDLLMSR